LWIELLKHAYYNDDKKRLETLPNIDINIQVGNSLISRFKLDEDLKKHKDKIEDIKVQFMLINR
jgi:adenine-specific DNA-methyltransferase